MNNNNTELRNFWENHIHQWSQSRKSQTDYCNENNLAIKSFGYWKRKLSKQSDTKFIEITKKRGRINPSTFIELMTSDGMVVRFREDIPPSHLKNIVSILRS